MECIHALLTQSKKVVTTWLLVSYLVVSTTPLVMNFFQYLVNYMGLLNSIDSIEFNIFLKLVKIGKKSL